MWKHWKKKKRVKQIWNGHILKVQVDIPAGELYLEFAPMDLDSDETSRDMDTAVLHRISIRIYGQSGLAWGAIFEKVAKYKEIHTFPKRACPKNPEMAISGKKKRRRPSGRDSQELLRRYPVWKLPPQNSNSKYCLNSKSKYYLNSKYWLNPEYTSIK